MVAKRHPLASDGVCWSQPIWASIFALNRSDLDLGSELPTAASPCAADQPVRTECGAEQPVRKESSAVEPVRTEFGDEQPVKTEYTAKRTVRIDPEAKVHENHKFPPGKPPFPINVYDFYMSVKPRRVLQGFPGEITQRYWECEASLVVGNRGARGLF